MPILVVDTDKMSEPLMQFGSPDNVYSNGLTVQVWFNEAGITVDVRDGESGEVVDRDFVGIDDLVDADLMEKLRDLVDGQYVHVDDLPEYFWEHPPERIHNEGRD